MKYSIASLIFISTLAAAWAAPDNGTMECSVPSHGIPGDMRPIVRLTIANDGWVTWVDTRITAAQLVEFLAYAKDEYPRPEFHIAAAADTSFSVILPVALEVQNADAHWILLDVPKHERMSIVCGLRELQKRQLPPKIHVTVRTNGALLWNGWPVEAQQFEQYSRAAAHDKSRPVIVIHPDRDATYGDVVGTMEKLLIAGLRDFAIGDYGHFVPERSGQPD